MRLRRDALGMRTCSPGARGVGKTSTARIFAKALNAPGGPSIEPDNDAEICRAIDAGEDVDVIEIDGASNRGIDEIRQLRSNANVRPSRARYKIYIIDEVHMLTTAAFNALLKTLEEPPDHVKFIFCTTDPQKIPITVLSRCQRFDFAPVETAKIVERLRFIVESEGRKAAPEALQLLARRAEGSLRDSQSLLEQLLAYCDGEVEVGDVHEMLGTARSGRLAALTEGLVRRDAAQALRSLDEAVAEGVDCGQFAEQLLEYFRDMMALAVGCGTDLLRTTAEEDHQTLGVAASELGLETIIAMVQILDQACVRMRQSTQPRVLLEIALVRMCHLDDLDQMAYLIDQLNGGPGTGAGRPGAAPRQSSAPSVGTKRPTPPSRSSDVARPSVRPKNHVIQEPASLPVEPVPALATDGESSPQTDASTGVGPGLPVAAAWKHAIAELGDMTADMASYFDHVSAATPDRLVVHFPARYTLQKESCEQPERKRTLEEALTRAVGRPVRIDLVLMPEATEQKAAPAPTKSLLQLLREKEGDPWVRQAMDLFDAEVTRVDPPRGDAIAQK